MPKKAWLKQKFAKMKSSLFMNLQLYYSTLLVHVLMYILRIIGKYAGTGVRFCGNCSKE